MASPAHMSERVLVSLNTYLNTIVPNLNFGKMTPIVKKALTHLQGEVKDLDLRVKTLDMLLSGVLNDCRSLELQVVENVYKLGIGLFYGTEFSNQIYTSLFEHLFPTVHAMHEQSIIKKDRIQWLPFFKNIRKSLNTENYPEKRRLLYSAGLQVLAKYSKSIKEKELYSYLKIMAAFFCTADQITPDRKSLMKSYRDEVSLAFRLLPMISDRLGLKLFRLTCLKGNSFKYKIKNGARLVEKLKSQEVSLDKALKFFEELTLQDRLTKQSCQMIAGSLLAKAASQHEIEETDLKNLYVIIILLVSKGDHQSFWLQNRETLPLLLNKTKDHAWNEIVALHRLSKTLPFIEFLIMHDLLDKKMQWVVLKRLLVRAGDSYRFNHSEFCFGIELLCKPQIKLHKQAFGERYKKLIYELLKNKFVLDDAINLFDDLYEYKNEVMKYTGRLNALISRFYDQYGLNFYHVKPRLCLNWIEACVRKIQDLPFLMMSMEKKVLNLKTKPFNHLKRIQLLPFNKLKEELISVIFHCYKQLDHPNFKKKALKLIAEIEDFQVNPTDIEEPCVRILNDRISCTKFVRK